MSKEDKKEYKIGQYGLRIETTDTETIHEIDGKTIRSPPGIRLVNIKGKKLVLLPQELIELWVAQKDKVLFDEIVRRSKL